MLINDKKEIDKLGGLSSPNPENDYLSVEHKNLSVNFAELDTFRSTSSFQRESQPEEDLDSKMLLYSDEKATILKFLNQVAVQSHKYQSLLPKLNFSPW
ncbi:unnamed protein product [Blepharisma stoltei]|uniref:Uncharacterized protein n=1 Tax=Blepharisma stoltei TaxID=1481888 RepID=A0AAU9IB59_9CILI|nr:unnamed protein product [Blepharisma stoltei]